MSPVVPPIKCHGIKTKLIAPIRALIGENVSARWIEPFCGSSVVAFNLRPRCALLTYTKRHIIRFYQAIQSGDITAGSVTRYLEAKATTTPFGNASKKRAIRSILYDQSSHHQCTITGNLRQAEKSRSNLRWISFSETKGEQA